MVPLIGNVALAHTLVPRTHNTLSSILDTRQMLHVNIRVLYSLSQLPMQTHDALRDLLQVESTLRMR